MLDSMMDISSHEQSYDGDLARLTEQALPLLSSAPITIVPGDANDKKPKMQTRRDKNGNMDSSPHL